MNHTGLGCLISVDVLAIREMLSPISPIIQYKKRCVFLFLHQMIRVKSAGSEAAVRKERDGTMSRWQYPVGNVPQHSFFFAMTISMVSMVLATFSGLSHFLIGPSTEDIANF